MNCANRRAPRAAARGDPYRNYTHARSGRRSPVAMSDTDFLCRHCDNVIGQAALVQPFKPGMSAMSADELAREDLTTHWAIALSDYTTSGCIITPHYKYGKGGKIRRIAKVWCNQCKLNLGNLQEADNNTNTKTKDLHLYIQAPIYHFLKVGNVEYRGEDGVAHPLNQDKDTELKWLHDSGLFNERFHAAFVEWFKGYHKLPRTPFNRMQRRRSHHPFRLYLNDHGLSLAPPTAEPVVVDTNVLPASSEAPIEAPAEQPDDGASEASAYTLPSTDDGAKADLERQLAGLRAASQADAKTDLLRQLEDLRVAVDRLTTTTVAILACA